MENILKYLYESPATIGAVALSLATIGYVFTQGLKQSSHMKALPSPPGPPRDFLIGNLRQFPKDHFFRKFCEWQKEYGDVVSVELPGLSMVILNSYDVVQELLVKRPNTTSGRKTRYMIDQMMGFNWTLIALQPGPHLTEQRKMLRRGIGPQRVGSHSEKIEKNATQLMLELRQFEGNPYELIKRKVGRIVVEVAYGKKILDTIGDELLSWNSEQMHIFSESFVKFWLVDIFNLLHFIPTWFPGASFKKIGNRAIWLSKQIRYKPFEKVNELYKSGEIGHSLVTDLLDEFGPTDDARDAVAVLYLTGADTTSAAITAYFNAMYLFPEVAQKVYEEIVAVTGGERMPTIADRSALAYTEAVWKEAFRWNTFGPLALPHVNQRDETVKGYHIKAGTMIHYNNGRVFMSAWQCVQRNNAPNRFILSDPKVWGDPESFRPERFLAADADKLPNPLVIIFGYGMRVCPGMYLADRIGFQIASTLTTLYDVAPLEGHSRPKPETMEYTDSLLRLPRNLECRFIARNRNAEELLKASALQY